MRGSVSKRTISRPGKRDRDVWRARYPDPEKPGADAKKEKTFATQREAQKWLNRKLAEIDSGTYIGREQADTLLRDVVPAWRATWALSLAPRTQVGYDSLLRHHVLPRFGAVRVSAITAPVVQRWVNELSASHHAETVHHAFTVLRQCMKVAVQQKLVLVNPCSREMITLPSKKAAMAERGEALYLTAGELRQLADAVPDHWRLAVLVAGLCGLRAGELWAIRRCDVDLLHGSLHVRWALKSINGNLLAGPTKTHASRNLSIPSSLLPAFAEALSSPGVRLRGVKPGLPAGYPCIKGTGPLTWEDTATDTTRLLFTTTYGHPVDHTNFYSRVFRPTVAKLWPQGHRLHALRWHDLRHTAASLAIAATGNLGIVQKRLGHENIQTTYNRYHHLLPDADKDLADTLAALFDATFGVSEEPTLTRPTTSGRLSRGEHATKGHE